MPGDGFHGDYDAYVIKFNATGGGPVFGTYLAGSPGAGSEQAWRAGHDSSGSVIVSGYATSPDGTTWTRYGNAPVFMGLRSWDSAATSTPVVIKVGFQWVLYFSGHSGDFV